jgi:hypothetical protein
MIEPIRDMPAGTVGFRVDGDVESEDYTRVLRPGLELAAAKAWVAGAAA